ncbi:MAG: threonine synthase [Candidatus Aenigmarchaeota archaeon]|nr:threonine synthase [Candidatus Aenigmarchaeota archaeon]
MLSHQQCFHCKKEYPADRILFWCPECGGSLVVHYKTKKIKKQLDSKFFKTRPYHWKYWMFYPIPKKTKRVTMNEGGTPLISGKRDDWFFKFEGSNPTGSFKDRGSTVEITHARQLGINKITCASTGNMGASVSAYSVRAGIKATIYVPRGATIIKRKQIRSYGARIVKIDGDYTDALNRTKELWLKKKVYLTGDYLYRQEGQKSVILESMDQMGFQIPKYVVLPVGMGNLCYATYRGLKEMKMTGLINRIPKIVAVQSYHCSTVVEAFLKNKKIPVVEDPETIASAISCGKPNYGEEALYALKDTKGKGVVVTDEELREAKEELAEQGIYAEASGAASYAGAKKLKLRGKTLMIVTGHGLKDTLV